MSANSRGRGKKTSTYKVKDPLFFRLWIFRNGQPDRDDDRKYIFCSKDVNIRAT